MKRRVLQNVVLRVVSMGILVAGMIVWGWSLPAGETLPIGGQWDARCFAMNAPANALVVNEKGEIFAGGKFYNITEYPGVSNSVNIARWDGRRWWNLGKGINGEVLALAIYKGDLYAGGNFGQAGGVSASYLARWGGTNWWPVGGGLNNAVYALQVFGDHLYVGGYFSQAGTNNDMGIARWNGESWDPFNGGISTASLERYVSGLTVHSNRLYVSGRFESAGGTAVTNNAAWDGTSWHQVGDGTAKALLTFTDDGRLFALGMVQFGKRQYFEWTGSAWTPLPIPFREGDNGFYNCMVAIGKDVYMGGSFYWLNNDRYNGFFRWDGTNCNRVGAPFTNTHPGVTAMVRDGNSLLVSGTSASPINFGSSIMARYASNHWEVLGRGMKVYSTALAVVSNQVIATGKYLSDSYRENYDILAKWNGFIWDYAAPALPTSLGNNTQPYALAYDGYRLYAGGSLPGGVQVWDGTDWRRLGPGLNAVVRAIAYQGTNVFAGTESGLFEWDGTAWRNLGITNAVYAVTVSGEKVYAAGSFANAGAVPANNVACWDGQSWAALGQGMNGVVKCLLMRGTNLYAGGAFYRAGDAIARNVAVWNGNQWSGLSSGVSGGRDYLGNHNESLTEVVTMAFSEHGMLYLGGNFTRADLVAAKFIVRWDGQKWSALSDGMDGRVDALVWNENKLYAVGSFVRAGNLPSHLFAIFHETPVLKWSESRTIAWSAHFPEYQLESASQLPDGPWSLVTNAVEIVGEESRFTPAATRERHFYRLKKD